MCWEMEIMDNGSADNEEDGDGDVYARYVLLLFCAAWPLKPDRRISIRLPNTEMSLGFNGGYAGAQVNHEISAYRSLSDRGHHSSSLQKMRTT